MDRRSSRWPLVGRRDELEIIDSALARIHRGVAAHVVIEGEPGIGKSRLVEASEGNSRI